MWYIESGIVLKEGENVEKIGKATLHFKNWLWKYCVRPRGTLEVLAQATGIPKSTLCKYKNFKDDKEHIDSITLDTVEIIADTLKVSPSYLVGWDLDFGKDVKEGRDILAYITELLSDLNQRNSLEKHTEDWKESDLITYEELEKYIDEAKEKCKQKKYPDRQLIKKYLKFTICCCPIPLGIRKKFLKMFPKELQKKKKLSMKMNKKQK